MHKQSFPHPGTPAAIALLVLSALISGCSTVPMRNYADPGEFGRYLFTIAEQHDARVWGTQLTAARRAMGEPYVTSHFERWRESLLQLKQAFGKPLEQVSFRIADSSGLEFESDDGWHLLFRVMMEDGGWKINQD